ncbi:hypothetical protein DRQ07_05020 [candidate division KSB1 bacterium]|nr:MAG: hypothetical protein DRQ07_05020 [candidate division KSB1 bacterium]
MKVNQSNISYVNYNRKAVTQNERPVNKTVNSGTVKDKPGLTFGDHVKQLNKAQKVELDFSKPLSSHLSTAERGMLNALFPKERAGFGVNAYQKIAEDTGLPETKGTSIDLTF